MSIFERQADAMQSTGGSGIAEATPDLVASADVAAEASSATMDAASEEIKGEPSFTWKHVDVATACAHCNTLLSNQYGVVGGKNPSLFYCREDCFRAANGMESKSEWPIEDKE